ncbi:MAG: hypothetical protein VX083_11690 [Pseudomonadota bacterium]|nr:hypothetical protein [Pseudomonadota bacterium]
MRGIGIAAFSLLLAGPVLADKLMVEGDQLIYDTDKGGLASGKEIVATDLPVMRRMLKENEGITTLRLNSPGGIVWVGEEMARIVEDYELDTVADGECSSTCVLLFLAGQSRQMTRGSKIGFHQTNWSAGSIEGYYNDRREDSGWQTPFDFASWMYQDTQTEVYTNLTTLLKRGVDPAFAIETIGSSDAVWFPSRKELVAGGVLRDAP